MDGKKIIPIAQIFDEIEGCGILKFRIIGISISRLSDDRKNIIPFIYSR